MIEALHNLTATDLRGCSITDLRPNPAPQSNNLRRIEEAKVFLSTISRQMPECY